MLLSLSYLHSLSNIYSMVRFLSFLLITTILACGSAVYAACPTMDGVTAIDFLKGCSTDSSEVAVISGGE